MKREYPQVGHVRFRSEMKEYYRTSDSRIELAPFRKAPLFESCLLRPGSAEVGRILVSMATLEGRNWMNLGGKKPYLDLPTMQTSDQFCMKNIDHTDLFRPISTAELSASSEASEAFKRSPIAREAFKQDDLAVMTEDAPLAHGSPPRALWESGRSSTPAIEKFDLEMDVQKSLFLVVKSV